MIKFFKAAVHHLLIGALMLCIGSAAIAGGKQDPLSQGLIAYFPLNGNAKDVSGHGNDGSATRVVFGRDRFGNASAAADFSSGNAWVDVPTLDGMAYTPVTYSAWLKLNSYPTEDEFRWDGFIVMTLVGRELSGSFEQGALCLYNPGPRGAYNSIAYYTGTADVPGQQTVPTNQWTHVVFTLDTSNNATFYLNGELVSSQGYTYPQSDVIPFRIGASAALVDWRYGWRGMIDDVRVYNRALASDEVAELFKREAPPSMLPPEIQTQPASRTAPVGAKARFAVVAHGAGTLSYQWTADSHPIAGATTSELVIAHVRERNAGTYNVVVSNAKGSVTSSDATLEVELKPMIFQQPLSQSVGSGSNVVFSVSVEPMFPQLSSGNLQLWLKADAGLVTNNDGLVSQWRDQSPNGNDAYQNDQNQQPQLVNPRAIHGRSAVRFNGVQSPTEGQYLRGSNLVDVPNAFTSFIVYKTVSAENDMTGRVMDAIGLALITGEMRGIAFIHGTTIYTTCTIDYDTHFEVPLNTYRIATQRMNADTTKGDFFDVTATTATNFHFDIAGALPPLPGYYLGGMGDFTRNFEGDIAEYIVLSGSVSDADRLAVQRYLDQKYYRSGPSAGYRYQWQVNGVDIPGATNATLTVPSAQATDIGRYRVIVSNGGASTISSDAALTVNPNPYAGAKGIYVGLFSEADEARVGQSGFLEMTLGNLGELTMRLFVGSTNYRTATKISSGGYFEGVIPAWTGSSFVIIDGQVDFSAHTIAGTVRTGFWTAPFFCERGMTVANSSPYRGRYTYSISGGNGAATGPTEPSFGTAMVDATGTLSAATVLSAGAQTTQAVKVTESGRWPFCVEPAGGRGQVIGWVAISPSNRTLFGNLSRVRLPANTWSYANGFTNNAAVLFGGPANAVGNQNKSNWFRVKVP